MKKMIIGISSLVLAILLALFSFLNLQNICKKSIQQGEIILETLKEEKTEKTVAEVQDFLTLYNKKRTYLGIYLNHSEIEDVDLLFYEISDKSQEENFEELFDCTEEIINRFKHIKKSEIPNFENIF